MGLNSTPADALANCYISLAEASSYVEALIIQPELRQAWQAASTAEQEAALITATTNLDAIFDWIGQPATSDQSLSWPRAWATVDSRVIDHTSVPKQVRHATVDVAVWILSNGGEQTAGSSADLQSLKVGPLSFDFNTEVTAGKAFYVPDHVLMKLRQYGSAVFDSAPTAKNVKVVRLVRG